MRIFKLFIILFFLNFNYFNFTIAAGDFSYVSVTPSNNSKNVRPDLEKIVLKFSNSVNWYDESFADDIVLKDEKNNLVETSKNIDKNTLEIFPCSLLKSNTLYYLSVPAGVIEYNGNINRPINISFRTLDSSFNYSSVSPSNKQSNVSADISEIIFTFKEKIKIGNLENFDLISVTDSINNKIEISPVIVNNYLKLRLKEDLKEYTTYNVRVPEGAIYYLDNEDRAYDYFNSEINIWFTTYFDNTPLLVLSPSSSRDYRVIDPKADIIVKFSKKIKLNENSNKITLKNNAGNLVPISLYISKSEDELIIKPNDTLINKTYYDLYIPKNSISDLYLNTLKYDYNFRYDTGIDLDPPSISYSSIKDSDEDVFIGTDEIVIKFDKNIKYSENYSKIELLSDNEHVLISKTIKDNTLTISIKNTLKENTNYTLLIPQKSLRDLNDNELIDDIVINFKTKEQTDPKSEILYIQKCIAYDTVIVSANIPFDDLIKLFLPSRVLVSLSNREETYLDVEWIDSKPEYDMNKPGTYTITGKIKIRDWIVNSKKITASIKVKIEDSSNPYWAQNSYANYKDRTSNSVEIVWSEAFDDSYIKEYIIELKPEGETSKNIKVPVNKAARLSGNINDSDYRMLKYNISGLKPSTNYEVFITAVDSNGNTTDKYLRFEFRTTAKQSNTKSSSSTTNKNKKSNEKNYIFDDLSGFDWAASAIESLAEVGIIRGTTDYTFSPGMPLTRADLVELLVRALNLKDNFTENFKDVDKSAYYYKSIGIAKKLGIVKGDNYGNFFPEQNIKREDIFAIVSRAIEAANMNFYGKGFSSKKYVDYDHVSDYAKKAVDNLVYYGIIVGDGSYIHPKSYATRAEIAVIISKIIGEQI